MTVKAIPTTYKGTEFRSRLEARWACFFEWIGWDYTYEPFDGDGYIPDFLIHGDSPLLVEVKPAVTRHDFNDPIPKLERGLQSWTHDILIVGASPLPRLTSSSGWDFLVAGLLGERLALAGPALIAEQLGGVVIGEGLADDRREWDWSTAHWMKCRECKRPAVFHDYQWYGGRPCGHAEGDHLMGHLDRTFIVAGWATASNTTKWRAR